MATNAHSAGLAEITNVIFTELPNVPNICLLTLCSVL